jgi:hypothetical protein
MEFDEIEGVYSVKGNSWELYGMVLLALLFL